MKKILEIIAVIVAVFFVIGACVFLSRAVLSEKRAVPASAGDEAASTVIIQGGP